MTTPTQGSDQAPTRRRWKWITLLLLLALMVAGRMTQRFADGPLGPIQGGSLRSGVLVTDAEVDWVLATQGEIAKQHDAPLLVEFELVGNETSRITGLFLHEGEIYLPCDLGFGWARFTGLQRHILHLVYWLKDWHLEAEKDGRIVLRIEGKRYERMAVRVTDGDLDAALRSKFEGLAEGWVAPDPYPAAPTEGPNDIWFFHLVRRG